MAKIKIAIDAGHGSNTAGKRTPPFTQSVDVNHDGKIDVKKGVSYHEHSANVGIASRLYQKLAAYGYDVIKTGWNDANGENDPDTPLSTRQQTIKKNKCDYSVAIHFNAYGDGTDFNSVAGVCVYIHSQYPKDSRHLADYVLQELIKGTSQQNRGIHSDNLAMCNCKTMNTKASILCEIAFMTNEQEAQKLMANSDFWEECATELAKGINRYCKCNNKEEPNSKGVYTLYHTVVAGDTLSKLAKTHNTTVDKLVKLNRIKNPNVISIGQKLILLQYKLYTVQKGDTLSKISLQYLGRADRYPEIMEFNSLEDTLIHTGQIIKIPVG